LRLTLLHLAVHIVAHFSRRRNLLLALLRHEIEHLAIWYRPANDASRFIHGLETIQKATRPSPTPSDAVWRQYIQLAWKINPALVVFIGYRYESSAFVQREVTRYVTKSPKSVMHLVGDMPASLPYSLPVRWLSSERLTCAPLFPGPLAHT